MSKMMNADQAFCAMRFFLEKMYELTQSKDIAVLLGGMTALDDGSLADSAFTITQIATIYSALPKNLSRLGQKA